MTVEKGYCYTMNVTEQGTREAGRQHYLAVPRTLVFLTGANPVTGADELLLLKGAPHKRLWAGKYNGLGGHVEAGEDIRAAAVREVWEEAGIAVEHLTLRGVVNIDTGYDEHGRRVRAPDPERRDTSRRRSDGWWLRRTSLPVFRKNPPRAITTSLALGIRLCDARAMSLRH